MALYQTVFLSILLTATLTFAKQKTPSISNDDVMKLANASNYFGLNMYRELAKAVPGNLFFSPLSISTAMGMLYEGAQGISQKELQKTLGYDKSGLKKEKVPLTFKNLLENSSNKDNKNYTLDNVNALFIDNKHKIADKFVKEAKDNFKAKVQNVDFAKDHLKIAGDINSFANTATRGKIPKIVDDVDPSTVMFLMNAVYFLGNWVRQFSEKSTADQPFYNGGDSTKQTTTKLMYQKNYFNYTQIADSQVLELRYKGGDISMIVILPNKRNGLSSLESQLNSDMFNQILRQLSVKDVKVSLPKFKIEYSKELSSVMSSLGAGSIFGPGANLRGISENVVVSKILHKAVVEVDEKGSEAAAVTGIQIIPVSSRIYNSIEFVADHPFIFAIVDRKTGMILFVGNFKNVDDKKNKQI